MSILVAGASALFALGHALWVVPRLPEPREEPLPGDPPKPLYRDLVTPQRVSVLVVGCFLFGLVVARLTPPAQWGLWIVYTGTVGTLVAIDALTTYLPRRLHYLAMAEMMLALILCGALAGWIALIWSAFGAAALGAVFWLIWRLGAGLGFGDVRLVVLVGLIAGTSGPEMVLRAALFGAVIGAVWAIIVAAVARLSRRQAGIFPYGPSLWLGPYSAVIVTALTG